VKKNSKSCTWKFSTWNWGSNMKNSLKWFGASPICLHVSFIAEDVLEESWVELLLRHRPRAKNALSMLKLCKGHQVACSSWSHNGKHASLSSIPLQSSDITLTLLATTFFNDCCNWATKEETLVVIKIGNSDYCNYTSTCNNAIVESILCTNTLCTLRRADIFKWL
jgi:hypothetical protein